MLFDICSITEQGAQNFIEKYGKINDKEFAIQMLVLTPNAWEVLDDALKNDSDIIMYYQPAIVGRSNDKYIPQKGFKLLNENESLLMPDITLPEDFDINTYFSIQRGMKVGTSIICKDDTKKYGVFELDGSVSGDVYIDAYDRTILPSLIDKYVTNKQGLSK